MPDFPTSQPIPHLGIHHNSCISRNGPVLPSRLVGNIQNFPKAVFTSFLSTHPHDTSSSYLGNHLRGVKHWAVHPLQIEYPRPLRLNCYRNVVLCYPDINCKGILILMGHPEQPAASLIVEYLYWVTCFSLAVVFPTISVKDETEGRLDSSSRYQPTASERARGTRMFSLNWSILL